VATRLRALLLTLGLVLVGVVGVAGPASADTGGYPYASYNGPGTNPAGSFWADSTGNGVSPYGYYYRNCTDYVAWKLQSLGISDAETRGLGNGGEWAGNATGRAGVTVSTTPSVNSAGVEVGNSNNPYGHVAFVEAVNSDGTLTVSEYNWIVNGTPDGAFHRRTATAASMGLSKFIDFGVNSSPPSSGSWGGVGSYTFRGSDTLQTGGRMNGGEYLMSSDGSYLLMMQSDGNLVELNSSGTFWNSHTNGHPGAYLVVQGDGNVVIYASNGTALWNTGQRAIQTLTIQSDGNLVARNGSGAAVWANSATQGSAGLIYKGSDTLTVGPSLTDHQFLRSSDGRYFVLMQPDGNLVLYGPGYHVLWHSHTGGHPGAYLVVQGDGNVVIYASNGTTALWNTGLRGAQTLTIQSDGNLVARNGSGAAVWATYTQGKI